jgi:hypothetical protein
MAFFYRRPLQGDAVQPVKDYPIASGTTIVPGDIVRLDSNGEIVKAATGSTTVLGVAEGTDFVNGKAKVRLAPDAVYEAEFVGAGALTVGTAYGIDGNSKMDTADTSVLVVKIVEVVNSKPYVIITALQMA